jgi:hypothetical protein
MQPREVDGLMGVLVTVTYACGGCGAKAESAGHRVRREFFPLAQGGGGALGLYRVSPMPDVTLAAPSGWVVFDPYTQQTYCAKCWAGIAAAVAGSDDTAMEDER